MTRRSTTRRRRCGSFRCARRASTRRAAAARRRSAPTSVPSQVVSGKFAWQEGRQSGGAQSDAVGDRLRQLWATPHGVIKAALANAGKVDGNTVTVNIDGREFKATLNAQNLVEKVSYLSTNEVVGDYPVEIAYTDYADFGGVKFPRHIVQNEDGFPTLDIMVNEVKPNAAVTIDVPANVQQATPRRRCG